MKLSARNVLKGRVVAITPGAVNVEVVIEIAPGVQVVSIITKSSAESLGLAIGKEAYAVVKASSVMVAVD
ncbi:MAG: molybdopterin-binding protein [Candidatus Promineofilum sp.]|nr:molybdopterin-binding protein [Promineifilum sp.]